MKKRALAFLLCLAMMIGLLPAMFMTASATEKIYITDKTFPDAEFRYYLTNIALKDVVNWDGIGMYIYESDAKAVRELDIPGMGIRNLRGIEYFTGLEKLDCSCNQLAFLDLSQNSSLYSLNCAGQRVSAECALRNGKYELDMKSLVGSFNLSNVSFTPPIAMNYDDETGIVTFDTLHNFITYRYYTTGDEFDWMKMDVTLTLSADTGKEKIYINKANFPDDIFRAYLTYDLLYSVLKTDNLGNYIYKSDARAVEEINVHNKGISSLKGIEYFTGLKRLYSGYNLLTEVDLSQNVALEYATFYSNQLNKLDVSKNTELKSLDCVSNHLAALDLSKNTILTMADIYGQKMTAKCTYRNGVYELDMKSLVGSNNISRITFVSVVDYNKATGIVSFEQMPKSITYTYDVKYKNQRMDVTITLSKAKDDRKLYINETNFPDDFFRTYLTEELLASVVEYDEEGFYVFESDAEAITEINILDENIRSLKGIEYFTGITNLNCEGNQLTALDLSGNCDLRNVTVQGQLATTKVGYRMETMARRSVEAGATYLVYLDTSDATLNNAKVVQVLVYGEDGSQQNASYVEELDAWRCTKKPVRVTYYYDVNVPGQRVLMDVTAETVELEEEAPAIAADLVFNRGSLSLQSYIAFNLTAKNSVLENYDSWYVVFERYDHFSQAVITETVEGIAYGTSNQLFEYKVSSYMMSDSITATLYAMKDGVTYKGEVYEESVESFVLSLMDNADEDQATLYTNLLAYGSEAQTYLGYNTSALADAKLNEYTSYALTAASDVESLYAETSKGLTGATKNKLALGISSAVQIQLRVDLDASYDVNTVYGELTYIRGNETITQRIDGKDFSESGSRYVLIFDAITAVDGRTPVQITIFDQNGNAISETWTYSISSYLVDGGLEGNALATMEALLNYFDSAAKVFGG